MLVFLAHWSSIYYFFVRVIYLSEIQTHLLSIEVTLMELDSSLGCRQRIGEVDPNPSEAFEELERRAGIKRTEQSLELLLMMQNKEKHVK